MLCLVVLERRLYASSYVFIDQYEAEFVLVQDFRQLQTGISSRTCQNVLAFVVSVSLCRLLYCQQRYRTHVRPTRLVLPASMGTWLKVSPGFPSLLDSWAFLRQTPLQTVKSSPHA